MTVPADDAELLAEIRRHGVRAGSRLHVVVRDESLTVQEEVPTYFGSFTGPTDLGQRSAEILWAEFASASK